MLSNAIPDVRPAAAASGITAETIPLHLLGDEQRQQWSELFAAQPELSNPFCSPLWVEAWFDHYVAEQDRRLLRILDGGRLIGVVPMYLSHLQVAGLPMARRMTMVGAGRSTPLELPQILAAPGHGRAVSRAVVAHSLDQDLDWTEISLTRDQGWFTPGLSGGWQSHRLGFQRHQDARACVVLPLAGTWEQTRATLKRNVKESLRRARNRLAKDGRPWRILHRTGADLDADAVDRLFSLHAVRASYQGSVADHHDAFADPQTRTFMRQLLPRLGAAGQATLVELELAGRVVATQLVLQSPNGIYFHSSGFLTQVWELSPITALQGSAIEAAIGRGERWVNFSPGPNESKLRWSEALHVVDEFGYGPAGRPAFVKYTAFSFAKDLRRMRHNRSISAREAGKVSGAANLSIRPRTAADLAIPPQATSDPSGPARG